MFLITDTKFLSKYNQNWTLLKRSNLLFQKLKINHLSTKSSSFFKSKNINQIVNEYLSIPVIKVYNLLPNLLMTHFSANEILAQIVYGFDCGADISFATIAHNSERIFRHGCFDPLANAEDEKASINNYAFSLFSVDHDFSERDFIGFTQRDYIDLHRTIIIQTNGDKSVLSFNLYAGQHNKELDDIQKCTREDNFADDNNNNAHL